MVTLGGITLSPDLALRGLDDLTPIAQNFRHTLMGGVVVLQLAISAGHELALVADDNSGGYLTHKQAEDIRALLGAGAPVVLNHPRGTYEVMIKQVTWEPLVEYDDVEDDDEGFGTIALIIKG